MSTSGGQMKVSTFKENARNRNNNDKEYVIHSLSILESVVTDNAKTKGDTQ